MAGEDLQAQYNHLLWQLGQLHEEAKIAGQVYQEKLKAIRKRSEKLNEHLHSLGSAIRKRHTPQVAGVAGRFPQEQLVDPRSDWSSSNVGG